VRASKSEAGTNRRAPFVAPLVPLRRITLHVCRHTYASYLMAAGYTLREIKEYLGHSSPAATERYVKLLPQPEECSPADRLNDYVPRAAGRSGW
jgi:integrase